MACRAASVSRQSVYAYLNGTTLPASHVFDKLLDALGIAGPERGRLATLRDGADAARRLTSPRRSAISAPAAGPRSPRQLPAHTPNFVGRAAELTRLDTALDDAPAGCGTVIVSAIGGSPGTGKTALALHWAHMVADRFPDGQLYVNLRGFDPSGSPMPVSEALRGFLGALGVDPASMPADAQAQVGLYRTILADKQLLVVLDNARDADQVRQLLPAGHGCLVVVTSRNPLASLIASEGARSVVLGALAPGESVELLTRYLGPLRLAAERLS
jgi:hypothetical protein